MVINFMATWNEQQYY